MSYLARERASSLERVFPVHPGEVIAVEPRSSRLAFTSFAWPHCAALFVMLSAIVTTSLLGRDVARTATAAATAVLLGGLCTLWLHRGTRTGFAAAVVAVGAIGVVLDGAAGAAHLPLSFLLGACVLALSCVALSIRRCGAPREQQLIESPRLSDDELFQRVLDGVGEVVALVDGELRFSYVSPSALAEFGHRAEELVGAPLERLVGVAPSPLHEAFRRASRRHGRAVRVEWALIDGSGRRRFVESTVTSRLDDPVLCAYVVTAKDVSERVALERQLRKNALVDPLTGAANRALLHDRAQRALERANHERHVVGVALVDFDAFKEVNDKLGRPAGDYVLSVVAQRLRDAVGVTNTVGRNGGDEFAVVFEQLHEKDELTEAIDHLVEKLREPIRFGANELELSFCVGSTLSGPGSNVDSLFEEADIALFVAKTSGSQTVRHYSPSMRPSAVGRQDLEAALRLGLERNEFELFFQPAFEVATGRLCNFEALLRWRRPGHGLIVPDEFVGFAEEQGLMTEIGRFVLRSALAHLKEFTAGTQNDELSVAVNLSASQLADRQLAGDVMVALATSGLSAHQLILEVAESVLAERPGDVLSQFERLADLGVRLAIDDFGTGYATSSFLKQLPIEMLKIDRTFVRACGDEPGRGVLESIVRLAQSLSLVTIAEGAEEEAQLEALVSLGCDMVQGFLLGHPITAEQAAVLAGRRSADEASVSPFLGSWLQRRVAKETERTLS